jgi:hypothetical protein
MIGQFVAKCGAQRGPFAARQLLHAEDVGLRDANGIYQRIDILVACQDIECHCGDGCIVCLKCGWLWQQ